MEAALWQFAGKQCRYKEMGPQVPSPVRKAKRRLSGETIGGTNGAARRWNWGLGEIRVNLLVRYQSQRTPNRSLQGLQEGWGGWSALCGRD